MKQFFDFNDEAIAYEEIPYGWRIEQVPMGGQLVNVCIAVTNPHIPAGYFYWSWWTQPKGYIHYVLYFDVEGDRLFTVKSGDWVGSVVYCKEQFTDPLPEVVYRFIRLNDLTEYFDLG